MKVCWLVPDDQWGGVFPVSYEVCRQGRSSGHDVRLLMICAPANGALPGSGVPLESLYLTSYASTAPAAILDWVAERGFDALVLNCCGEADPIPPYLPESIRCVYVVHNSPRRYWEPAVRHERYIERIVAISDYVAGIVRPCLRFPQRLVTIRNGSTYPEAPAGSVERPEDLLFLGGEEPRKGAGDLLRMWSELARLQFKGRLHWCGQMSDAFKSRVSALPATRQIVIHGRVPREKVFQLAAECKVLLMLSRAEAFGMVTIEAMSMGCLPVAWDIDTGTKEIAQPGIHGLFAPMGDYRLLARTVIEANAKQSSLAAGITARAREAFSVEHTWAGYEQSLCEVLTTPRLRRPLAGRTPPRLFSPPRPSQLLPPRLRMALKRALHGNPRVAHMLNRYWGM